MEEALDVRLARARAVLARAGMEADTWAEGAHDEIVVVAAPLALRSAVARLAPELRACGFRYVALELDVERPAGPGSL
jgi:hypothetical protein